ncbi:uncharacterized protein C15orf57 homolog isoform X2 [Heterocephalus glaber]|uniref:Uncharacterized protein C15orf57 homolog isoform X2 n=2 Tax=Heterocephalus glaber TaxID=10181 RepID=A0AAX6RN53_HETGA|nr:uncharacterized protein C15orf57 homolog isoform X2 [Heterocephalus glaber]
MKVAKLSPLDQCVRTTSLGQKIIGGLLGPVTRRLLPSLLPSWTLLTGAERLRSVVQALTLRFQMKMFESIDCAATNSGRDLWSEICSCLPNPDQEDAAYNAFSDSFVDSYPVGKDQGEAADFAVQSAIKPWAPLQDSEMYLASLEKKLRRIKGLNEEVTSKDMLRTLAQAKKECWDRFLQEKLASEFFVDGLDSDERQRPQLHPIHTLNRAEERPLSSFIGIELGTLHLRGRRRNH